MQYIWIGNTCVVIDVCARKFYTIYKYLQGLITVFFSSFVDIKLYVDIYMYNRCSLSIKTTIKACN